MAKNLKYLKYSDEEIAAETRERLKEIRQLLAEIRDLLKAAGGLE